MITSVLFDMGGTLEDVFADEQSGTLAVEKLDQILKGHGIDLGTDLPALQASVDAGWARYGRFRDPTNIELKPVEIWCDYVLADFQIPREKIAPYCEEIAHMWEVTHYHRSLRPRAAEMLSGLKGLGLKLGVVSNTAALYQVFDSLEEYGIRDFFQDVTLSSVTGFRKPCRDIFTVALRQLRSRPEECVYVGDTISRDIIGSKQAGFAAAIQICSQLTAQKDSGIYRAYEPDYRISDIYEVLPIVTELLQNPNQDRRNKHEAQY